MKRTILPLTLVLPVLAAATAAAQLTSVRFAAPVDPVANLPVFFPGLPAGSPVNPVTGLPVFTPCLLAGSPIPFASAAPDNTIAGLPKILPIPLAGSFITIRPMATAARPGPAAPSKPGAAKPEASKEKFDELFDGEGVPTKPAVDRPGRITLPERDLERELGI